MKATLKVFVSVINPSVRLSWIKDHWDEDYNEHATTLIKALVSDLFSVPEFTLFILITR